MNSRNLLIASLVGGIASTILSNVPILNFVNCLLCLGFWGGPLLAVWLYKRQAGSMTIGQGVAVGLAAGAWAGVFGFGLSRIGLAGAEALVRSYAPYLPPGSGIEGFQRGGSSLLFDLVGVGFNILFGAIGGLLGGAIFKSKSTEAVKTA